MSHEALFRRWHEEIWNQQLPDAIDELMAPDGVLHDSAVNGAARMGREEFKAQARALHRAFPDIHFEIEQLIEHGEHASARVTITGTHSGDGLGVPPTGKRFRIGGMSMGRVRDGQIVEGWNSVDFLGLFQQLGLVERPSLKPSAD